MHSMNNSMSRARLRAHTHNPSTPKAMAGGAPQVQVQLGLYGKFQVNQGFIENWEKPPPSRSRSLWQCMSGWGHRKDREFVLENLQTMQFILCIYLQFYTYVHFCIWWEPETTPTPQRIPSCIASASRSSPSQTLVNSNQSSVKALPFSECHISGITQLVTL